MEDPTNQQTILIVEDNDDDYLFTRRAFKIAQCSNPLHRAHDGQEALDFLRDSTPSTILLDINMPGLNGYDFLEQRNRVPEFRRIPVIVLTTSDDPQDIAKSYEKGANSYIHKPVTMQGFVEAIARLKDYWFQISLLPGN